MPDAFKLAFDDWGEKIEEYLDLAVLDPMYRIYFSHSEDKIDVRPGLDANLPQFEQREP